MRRIALSVVCLSLPVLFAGCGDDIRRTVNGIPMMPDGGGGIGGDGGVLPPPPDGGMNPDATVVCPSASFLSPMNGAMFTAADDKDNGACATNGFQTDVRIAVGAADGTRVNLLANNAPIGSATVVGGLVTFTDVTLGTAGVAQLTAQVGAGEGCTVTSSVTVDCATVTCNITKPVISEAHPKLNNVPADEGGDRASLQGSDYQAAFEVTTSAPDSSAVQLEVRRMGSDSLVVVNATVTQGKATFAGVTLRPDGQFQVQAVCKSGRVEGRSVLGTYTVDTVAPDLVVTKPTGDDLHFDPDELTNNTFEVCGSTTATDAVALGDGVGNMGKNFCVGIGAAAPECSKVTAATGGGSGCVSVQCPGGAPFALTLSLRDEAANLTTKSIPGVSCASMRPNVEIVTPSSDAPMFMDVSKRLLAATAPETQAFKDLNATQTGAQTNVVACTNSASGRARLLVGLQGADLVPTGDEVTLAAAVAADNCPTGLGFVAKWNGITLPQSTLNADGTLQTATELVVRVTDISTTSGDSPAVRLWVDSVSPILNASQPNPLCGAPAIQSSMDVSVPLVLQSTTGNVSVTITGPSTSQSYTPANFQGVVANFGNVTFYLGQNTISAVASDPAGNTTSLPTDCRVIVGQVPIVTWLNPAVPANLCAAGNTSTTCVADADPAAGWQGSLRVGVSVGGAAANSGTVTFSVGGTELGTANIDPTTGEATLDAVTIPDGTMVTLTALTSDLTGSGTGQAVRSLQVDTVTPTAVAVLTPNLKNRRETSFTLVWNAPADVSGYVIKSSTTAFTDAASFDTAPTVPYAGTPAASGAEDRVDATGLKIETQYFFAIAPIDAVGNRGPVTTSAPITARFNSTTIPAPLGVAADARFGGFVDGSGDLDGDTKGDLLVSALDGGKAYIFFGADDINALANPVGRRMTTLTGPSGNAGFGRSFINAGDLDGDGIQDIAVGASRIGQGRVYILRGRTTWAANYNLDTDADYVIELDGYTLSRFGETMVRLGNYDGAGGSDLAIGASGFQTNRGRVVIVFGGQGALVPPAAGATLPVSLNASNLSLATIEGEATELTGRFGDNMMSVSATGGADNSLIVSAPRASTNTGKVYRIGAVVPSATPITVGAPVLTGPAPQAFYGDSLSHVGFVGTSAVFAVGGSGTPIGPNGFLDVYRGSAGAGLFAAPPIRFVNPAASFQGDAFGRLAFGGQFPGTSVATNLVGDAEADLVVSGTAESGAPARIYIVDGQVLSALPAAPTTNIGDVASVTLSLPADWNVTSPFQRMGQVRDMNNDGFGEIAVGEWATTAIPGRLQIFW